MLTWDPTTNNLPPRMFHVSLPVILMAAGCAGIARGEHDWCGANGTRRSPLFAIVTGLEHSGTTVLSRLIMNAPGVFGGFECGLLLAATPAAFRRTHPWYQWMQADPPSRPRPTRSASGGGDGGAAAAAPPNLWSVAATGMGRITNASCHAEAFDRLRAESPVLAALRGDGRPPPPPWGDDDDDGRLRATATAGAAVDADRPPRPHRPRRIRVLDKTPRYVLNLAKVLERAGGCVPCVVSVKPRATQVRRNPFVFRFARVVGISRSAGIVARQSGRGRVFRASSSPRCAVTNPPLMTGPAGAAARPARAQVDALMRRGMPEESAAWRVDHAARGLATARAAVAADGAAAHRVHVVEYERLRAAPSEVMAGVFSFLGLRWRDEFLAMSGVREKLVRVAPVLNLSRADAVALANSWAFSSAPRGTSSR